MEIVDYIKQLANRLVLGVVLLILAIPVTVYVLVYNLVSWWVEDIFGMDSLETYVEWMIHLITIAFIVIVTLSIVRTVLAHI